MTSGMPLAKPHLLLDYCKASKLDDAHSKEYAVDGVVYIETDVRYDPPSGDVSNWAKGPLDEVTFLRKMVEGKYGQKESDLLLGLVPWIPMDQPTSTVEQYLQLAEQAAGKETWRRVKGFRFLLQAIKDEQKFRALVSSEAFIENLKLLGRRGFAFDIGVDENSAGVWQLEAMAQAMAVSHQNVAESQKVVFIINHLCKPKIEGDQTGFRHWCDAVAAMAALPKTYMKLSGALSEMALSNQGPNEIASLVRPWAAHVLQQFGASRVMFGSDWPVCNAAMCNTAHPTEETWVCWKDVVNCLLESDGLKGTSGDFSEDDKERVWRGTAREAYHLV